MQDMSSDLIRFLQRQQGYSCSSQGVAHRHLRVSQTHPSGGLQGHSKFIVILRHHIRHYFPVSLYWHLPSWCQTPGSLERIKGTATQCISNHCIFNIMPSRGEKSQFHSDCPWWSSKIIDFIKSQPWVLVFFIF